MLNPQLKDKCCSDKKINNLLTQIDVALRNTSLSLLNNIRYSLFNKINDDVYEDLLLYKNIIISKMMNTNNLKEYHWDKITSRVKNLINKL